MVETVQTLALAVHDIYIGLTLIDGVTVDVLNDVAVRLPAAHA